ncbi:hypothetical protein [Streptomyces marispadix]|uniref:Uncharacterized protein n=1 Tax=Streptomyces marispadix TaxID=2922868 RepID=A0ABS9T2U2_9ACTN|nr:hypothetical protein [Streptomyces marispadix]MCH6162778.1 hypothetical protein [Streptomyces marispadix]
MCTTPLGDERGYGTKQSDPSTPGECEMYYGHEAGFLRIAELRQKAAAERRAREAEENAHQHVEGPRRPGRRAGRYWFRTA